MSSLRGMIESVSSVFLGSNSETGIEQAVNECKLNVGLLVSWHTHTHCCTVCPELWVLLCHSIVQAFPSGPPGLTTNDHKHVEAGSSRGLQHCFMDIGVSLNWLVPMLNQMLNIFIIISGQMNKWMALASFYSHCAQLHNEFSLPSLPCHTLPDYLTWEQA